MMKEMKKIFDEPKLDVIQFTAQDVIATSGPVPKTESDFNPDTEKFSMFD